MQCVHAVGVDEPGKIGRAADAANGHDVVIGNLEFDEPLLNRRQHSKVAAPRTPVGINPAFQIGYRQLICSLYACGHVRLLQTIISCSGTERFVFPASCSLTASTMW